MHSFMVNQISEWMIPNWKQPTLESLDASPIPWAIRFVPQPVWRCCHWPLYNDELASLISGMLQAESGFMKGTVLLTHRVKGGRTSDHRCCILHFLSITQFAPERVWFSNSKICISRKELIISLSWEFRIYEFSVYTLLRPVGRRFCGEFVRSCEIVTWGASRQM